jgi:hypothetical protein
MRIALFLFCFISLSAISGCQKESPTINEETYIDILAELELIHVLYSQAKNEELTRNLISEVWTKYHVSEEDFLFSHFLYEQDVNGQIRRIQTISERLTFKHLELEDSLGSRYLDVEY